MQLTVLDSEHFPNIFDKEINRFMQLSREVNKN